ncbi:MAG TPA: site-specific DNA-methyltransferase [Marinilabiliales bacterium]|nr:MAG: modification methylase [Bacteroidetes bacterium GWA2_40_14]OFX62244.1 MAG: modification methylase [Bacteroidetes bacterium GWC2_40_13]OFX73800.1 MAG: modification methylase [Bacteroidetes bacterium GWD2_40_43]OFX89428.1 MAG: modification methylase [Bacteroidetes bacterium GWE2_40_63]OFY23254.1 MAG: modification methylase [Bacteroidetes bacterium GWF2_40_13]OFZ28137.1 MAG: modification methylase [Bacteroidetes bacterium RIFOXYC2_FULL_40_12]HAM97485.1 site-specific DNA-methyltransferase
MFNKIKNVLGNPFYENEDSIIYNMDCLEGLKILRDNNIKIDSTITSPPYNIGKEYENIKPVNDFVNWITEISDLIYDITKSNGCYLLNVGYMEVPNKGRAVPITYLLWDKLKFYLNQEIIWNYGAGVAAKNYLSPRNEKILWYIKNYENYTFNLDDIRDPDVKYPNQKKNGKLRCNTLGKNPSDVWQIAKVTSGANRSSEERTDHPAQFPVDLITRMVLGFTNQNNLVLDPFMGSGTTAEVCMKNNRKSIGFEIREDYCQTIKNRLENVIKQEEIKAMSPTLFQF